MKKITLILFISLILLLSSCGSGNPGNTTTPKNTNNEDLTGSGLEINFDIDDEWISIKRLDYTLEIKNTGKEIISLNNENVQFGSIWRNNEGSSGVFTDESVDKFLTKLFESSDLELRQNQERNFAGSLIIGDWFYNDLTKEKFEWFLNVNYDYKTNVQNNILIDRTNSRNIIKVTDKLSQAAPIQIERIETIVVEDDIYRINFEIEDRAKNYDKNVAIILNIDLRLGTESLTDCLYYVEESGNKKQIDDSNVILNDDRDQIIYSCKFDFGYFDKSTPTNTIISGEITYNYDIQIIGEQRLPEGRADEFLFE